MVVDRKFGIYFFFHWGGLIRIWSGIYDMAGFGFDDKVNWLRTLLPFT